MSIRTIVAPSFEPITLLDAKAWCRIDDDDTSQDAMMLRLITTMRVYAENYTGRVFGQRQREIRLWTFPAYDIVLPEPPLVSVDDVSYVDINGTLVSMAGSPSQYRVDTFSEPGILRPLYNESWPSTLLDYDAVRIQFTCGYANAAAIPQEVKQWMQARISTLNENREQIITGTIVAPIPFALADGLLDTLRVGRRMF